MDPGLVEALLSPPGAILTLSVLEEEEEGRNGLESKSSSSREKLDRAALFRWPLGDRSLVAGRTRCSSLRVALGLLQPKPTH